MTTAKVAQAIFQLTSVNGLPLGGGRSIKLAEKTRILVKTEGDETWIEFTPPARVGQEILGVTMPRDCPRIRFEKSQAVAEIDGWMDQILPYSGE